MNRDLKREKIDRSHKRVGPQEKTWWGNLKASDLEKQVSSRYWLVHQIHLEFWEHMDFNIKSPQLRGGCCCCCCWRISILMGVKGFRDEPSSATTTWKGWHIKKKREKKKKSSLELEIENTMDDFKLKDFLISLLFCFSFFFYFFWGILKCRL